MTAQDDYYRILVNGQLVKPSLVGWEWARWFENADNRRVGETWVGNIRISTVCLGMDHSFGDGPPLWFETMVFGGQLDQEQERYSTLEQAQAGHDLMVERVQENPMKPQPKHKIAVKPGPGGVPWLDIFATPEMRGWVEFEAPTFGRVIASEITEGKFTLFVNPLYDFEEVKAYFERGGKG